MINLKTNLKNKLYEIVDILNISIYKELYYTFDDRKLICNGPVNTHTILIKFDKGEIDCSTKIRFLDILSYKDLDQDYFYINNILQDDDFVLNIHPSSLYYYSLESNIANEEISN